MADIKIVKMKKADLKELFKIGKNQWPDESWLTMSYIESSFKQDGLSYTAKMGNKIVGGIIMVFEDIVRNWLRYLIIDKNFRQKGLGTRLLKKVENALAPGEGIYVDTGIINKITIKFYEKNGYKNLGKIKNLYKNRTGVIYKKIIK